MEITVTVSDEELELFERFAQKRWQGTAVMVREVVLEKIEDEHDLRAYEETMEAHRRNSFSFSLDEVKKEVGIL